MTINTPKKLEYLRVADLRTYDRNARTHSPQQVAQLVANVRTFGWTNPLIVDERNQIIAGHGRLAAARELGMDEVPLITRIAGGDLAPLLQYPHPSSVHGTITLMGMDGAESLPPHFGSTARRAAIFRCSAAGMADDPVEVLPHVLLNANSASWHLVWNRSALIDAGPATSYVTMDLMTGTTGALATPNAGPAASWVNLGHAALLMPGQNVGGTSGTFTEHGAGMARAQNFAAAQGPTSIQSMQLTAQPDINSKTYSYVATDHASISEHEIDLDGYLTAAPLTGDLVHRVKDFRALTPLVRCGSVRNGVQYVPVEVRVWEVWRGALGSVVLRTDGAYQHKLYPCQIKKRTIRMMGLLKISSSGAMTFTKWSEKRMHRTVNGLYYRGESRLISSGVETDLPHEWYFNASGSTPTAWPAVANFAADDVGLDLPSQDGLSSHWVMSDRLVMRGAGFYRFWSYAGVWLGDVPFPAGAASNALCWVVTGDDVMTCGNFHSRDYGATWSALATGYASGNALFPVRLF